MAFQGLITQAVNRSRNNSLAGSLSNPSQHLSLVSADIAARSVHSASRSGVFSLDPHREGDEGVSTVSSQQATINLICGGLGTGMFSLPWSMAGASVLPGLLVIVLVVLVNGWTIMILVEAAEKYKSFDLGSLLRHLPGRIGTSMEAFANVMVWVAMMLSLISYIITIHDSAAIFVKHTWLAHDRLPLVGIAAVLVLPLCYLDQKYLSWTSLIATLANVNLFILLATLFGQHDAEGRLPHESCLLGFAKGGVTMISAMMQCIIIQMCVLPMYEVLENRSPQKFRRVLAVAFCTLIIIFSGFSVLAYLIFGPTVKSNVLLDLPRSGWSDASQASIILVVMAVYPIMLLPMLAPIRSLGIEWFLNNSEKYDLMHSDETRRESMVDVGIWRRKCFVNCITVVVVAVSFVGAYYIESLGFINVVDGSLCVGVFTSLVPGLVGLVLLERNSQVWRVSMAALLCIGAVAFVVGLALTKNYRHDLHRSCVWRMGDARVV